MNNNVCKMCNSDILPKRLYCSNICKFADTTYNKSRGRLVQKPPKLWMCNLCEWGTNDYTNKSGAIVKHLTIVHEKSRAAIQGEYPNIIVSIREQKQATRLTSELSCKICGEFLEKITHTHLKKHNLTPTEYKIQYNCNNTANEKIQIKQRSKAIARQVDEIFNGSRLSTDIKPAFLPTEYVGCGNNHSYLFKCMICMFEFPDNLDNGHIPICKNCNPPQAFSPNGQAQTELYDFIRSVYTGTVLLNNRTVIKPKELDIVLPDLHLAIEYHGLYWHSEIFMERTYHLKKLQLCHAQGYRLIQIFEDEWINKKDIVKNKIKHLLGIMPTTRIYARNVTVSNVSVSEATEFLNRNHLQGDDISTIRYGLYHFNALVGLATFSKPRRALGQRVISNNLFELSRLCFPIDTIVVGGVSKLLHNFKIAHPNVTLYSYADLRYVNEFNNTYIKCGFKLNSQTKPNYWYFKVGTIKRYHRFGFTKQQLIKKFNAIPDGRTEYDVAKQLGYDRIWDCGHLKYELDIT